MKNSFKEMNKAEKIKIIIILSLFVLFLLLGIFTPILFPGTNFATKISATIGKFFDFASFFQNNYGLIIETLAIIVFIWVIDKVINLFISMLIKKRNKNSTIGNLIMSSLKYIFVITGIFLILSAWGVQTPTLLASAGIIGLALSFGAQSLIEDIFAGLFIIFEKQFSVGDVIQVGDFRGVVKEIGIRITKFEDVHGDLKMINNSDIRGAINSSNSLSQAICEISISYDQDIEKFDKFMKDNIGELKGLIPTVKNGPFYEGVEKFGDSGITVRIVAWVRETDRLRATRELNKHVKILFDKNKINVPFPQIVIHSEKQNNSSN